MSCRSRNIAITAAFVAGIVLAGGTPARAQMGRMPQTPSPYSTGQNQPGLNNMPDTTAINTVSDSDFAKEAAEGGMAEVKFGQLAQDKGASDAVKEFGKRMVDDHSQANDKLKNIAERENVKLPQTLSKKDQSTYDRLSKLSGDAFDRAYAHNMVKDHETDIASFQQEAANGRDPGIKTFASETLPTLQEHLKSAKEMMKSVSSNAAKGGSGSD